MLGKVGPLQEFLLLPGSHAARVDRNRENGIFARQQQHSATSRISRTAMRGFFPAWDRIGRHDDRALIASNGNRNTLSAPHRRNLFTARTGASAGEHTGTAGQRVANRTRQHPKANELPTSRDSAPLCMIKRAMHTNLH